MTSSAAAVKIASLVSSGCTSPSISSFVRRRAAPAAARVAAASVPATATPKRVAAAASPPAVTDKLMTQFVANPSQIAQALDWRKASGGTILSMSIGRDSLDMAIGRHPSAAAEDKSSFCTWVDENTTSSSSAAASCMHALPSIPIETTTMAVDDRHSRRVLCPSVSTQLSKVMTDYNVCGWVVSWPLQSEGWAGAPCGRVLFTLDQLLLGSETGTAGASSPSSSSSSFFNSTASRAKLCFWNEAHTAYKEDEWGRCPHYARRLRNNNIVEDRIHLASKEQYTYQSSTTRAMTVWDDFCRVHWPEEYNYNQKQAAAAAKTSKASAMTSDASAYWNKRRGMNNNTSSTSTSSSNNQSAATTTSLAGKKSLVGSRRKTPPAPSSMTVPPPPPAPSATVWLEQELFEDNDVAVAVAFT